MLTCVVVMSCCVQSYPDMLFKVLPSRVMLVMSTVVECVYKYELMNFSVF